MNLQRRAPDKITVTNPKREQLPGGRRSHRNFAPAAADRRDRAENFGRRNRRIAVIVSIASRDQLRATGALKPADYAMRKQATLTREEDYLSLRGCRIAKRPHRKRIPRPDGWQHAAPIDAEAHFMTGAHRLGDELASDSVEII
jgi:hypothetical protein